MVVNSILSRIPSSIPPATPYKSWLTKYEEILIKNASQISSIESSLRSLSFILPGRFKDAEVASETLTSALQILGLYHDSILSKAAKKNPDSDFKPSLHNKYTEDLMNEKKIYKVLSLFLSVTQYTELLWETVGKQKDLKAGNKDGSNRWKTIIGIESLKSVVRIALILSSKRPLVSPPIPEREYDPAQLQQQQELQKAQQLSLPSTPSPNSSGYLPDPSSSLSSSWIMPRTGTPLPETPLDSKSYLSSKVLNIEDVQKPINLISKLSFNPPKQLIGELLYILRPLLYALLAYKFRNKPRNWTPWFFGIALEYYARNLIIQHYQQTLPKGVNSLTKLESEELKKRAMVLWWWSVRGAMYQTTIRPLLHGFTSRIENIPLMNLFGGILQDYLYLLDNYHFSSSSL